VDRIADVASLIVVAAIVGVIVGSRNTRGQIQALTSGFSDVLRAATSAGR
jgi:hypothetical protein